MPKEAAGQIFRKGLNCAQSVLTAYSDRTGIPVSDSLRLATGFGAGIAKMQSTCGAVTGAYMVIGAIHGRVNPDDEASRDKTYALIEEFNRRFIERHGSFNCMELLGVDLRSDEGIAEAEAGEYFEKKCASYVEDAERILNEIL